MQLPRHSTVLKKKDAIKLTESVFEERPTKLEIDDTSIPMGGSADGMDDINNTPMPPMDAEPMGGEEPMIGQEPMGDPNEMGNGDDGELMDAYNSLSTEDKAAALKYIKSMADDSNDGNGEEMPMNDNMPMESRRNVNRIIDEVIGDVLGDDKDDEKRFNKKLPKQYRKMETPFKSQY